MYISSVYFSVLQSLSPAQKKYNKYKYKYNKYKYDFLFLFIDVAALADAKFGYKVLQAEVFEGCWGMFAHFKFFCQSSF